MMPPYSRDAGIKRNLEVFLSLHPLQTAQMPQLDWMLNFQTALFQQGETHPM